MYQGTRRGRAGSAFCRHRLTASTTVRWVQTSRMKTQEKHAHSTTETQYVWVYQYVYWDDASHTRKTSERFATLEVIRCGLGSPVHASAKKIPVSQLIDGMFSE